METSFEVNPDTVYQFGGDVSEYSSLAVDSFEFEEFAQFDIDPITATEAKPGSKEKVQMLSARYAAGLPLWHQKDCDEHGPGEPELKGSAQQAPEKPLVLDLEEFQLKDSAEVPNELE